MKVDCDARTAHLRIPGTDMLQYLNIPPLIHRSNVHISKLPMQVMKMPDIETLKTEANVSIEFSTAIWYSKNALNQQ